MGLDEDRPGEEPGVLQPADELVAAAVDVIAHASGATVERILDRTLAGGVTINDTLWHFGVEGLPFGGIGPSGMGAMHGKAGFDAFSKQLPVLRQSAWAATDWLVPPYRGVADRLIRWLAR